MDFSNTLRYVEERQNDDGGFFFARQAGYSTVEDTYFAISIIKAIGENVPRQDKVINFIKSFQSDDGSFSSIQVANYIIKSLTLLGEEFYVSPRFASWLLNFQKNNFWLSAKNELSLEAFEAASSVLRATGLIKNVDKEFLLSALLSFKRPDGGFGISQSTLSNTYLAVKSLRNLGQSIDGASRDFISSCELKGIGFTEVPRTFPPTIFDLFHGFWLANATKYELDKKGIEDFLIGFMNINGGFRPFPQMGISTLEHTYYAIGSLAILENWKNAELFA
ncbi:MAG: prenyltransferase/squalene oxidase repeat-containing protein [Thermoprotei archaeon]